MSRSTARVKRAYDSTGRQQRAREQRRTTLTAARELFLRDGYPATTVDSIAHAVGISAATIYKSYGGKTGLVRALCAEALKGEGPVPAERRSDALQESADSVAIIEGWARLAAEVSPRVSPLLLLLRAAATGDPEAAALLDELERERLVRMAGNARHLVASGRVRPDLSVNDVRDVLWYWTAPETYELLMVRRRWTAAKFSRFLASTMRAALLG